MNWRPVKTLSSTELGLHDFIDLGPAPRLICDHPMRADTHCGDIGHPTPLCIDRKRVTYPDSFKHYSRVVLDFGYSLCFVMSTFFENNALISTCLFDLRFAKSLDGDGGLCTCLAHISRRNNFQISTSVFSEKFWLSSSRYQMVVVIGEGALGVQFELQLLPSFNCNVDCHNTRSKTT
jgi:hypothetical protein